MTSYQVILETDQVEIDQKVKPSTDSLQQFCMPMIH